VDRGRSTEAAAGNKEIEILLKVELQYDNKKMKKKIILLSRQT